jgi:hypothetical protein
MSDGHSGEIACRQSRSELERHGTAFFEGLYLALHQAPAPVPPARKSRKPRRPAT